MDNVIKDYNISHQWGDHMVEVELRRWAYGKTYLQKVGGNCKGAGVLETAVSLAYDTLLENWPDDDVLGLVLLDADGGELLCMDDEDQGEEWFKDMVVGCHVVTFEKTDP